MPWTFLRPGPFALNCRNWSAPQIRNGNVVRWFYGDAATAPVHEHDLAAVAVRTLCEEGHDGRDYVLTGPESLTQREQLTIIGDAIPPFIPGRRSYKHLYTEERVTDAGQAAHLAWQLAA